MWIDYTKSIVQSEAELQTEEKRRRGRVGAERVKVLRLLKSRAVRSLHGAAGVVGYSERQVQRWWAKYRAGGLAGMLEQERRGGRCEQVNPEAWGALRVQMRAGGVTRLKEAQQYLREHYEIVYTSLNGVSQLFKRHKVKLKTGRRRHRKADPRAQATFKK